jgi:hypothetical protein
VLDHGDGLGSGERNEFLFCCRGLGLVARGKTASALERGRPGDTERPNTRGQRDAALERAVPIGDTMHAPDHGVCLGSGERARSPLFNFFCLDWNRSDLLMENVCRSDLLGVQEINSSS